MSDPFLHIPFSPLELLRTFDKGIKLHIKRDDLVHPVLEGNKFRKLKYNYYHFLKGNLKVIITSGGAFSNHLVAVSQLGRLTGIRTFGLINNSYADLENPSLSICRRNGMAILLKNEINPLLSPEKFGIEAAEIFYIPEGGSNIFGLRGCEDIVPEITSQLPEVTHIVVPSGTGSTFTGMSHCLPSHIQLIAVNVLKMDLKNHLRKEFGLVLSDNNDIWEGFHFGKYGAYSDELIKFIIDFYSEFQLLLDPIYNSKGIYAVYDQIKKGYFQPNSQIVYLQTGGNQGTLGFNQRFGKNLPCKNIDNFLL